MQDDSPIDKLDSSLYNIKQMAPTCDVFCVGNGRFFYLKEDDLLDLHVLVKKYTLF